MTGFFWEPEALPALKLKEHLLALICVSGRQLTLLSLVWYGLVWSGESPSMSPDNPVEWTYSQPSRCVNLLLRGNFCHALVDLCFPRLWNVFCVHVILKDGPRKVNFLVFPCGGQSWWHLPPGSGDRHLPSHPGSPGHPQHSLADQGASAVGQKEHLARPVGKPIRLLTKAWHSHVANRKATTKPCMFCAFRLYFLVSGFASLIWTVLSAGKGPCCTLVSLPNYLTLFLTGAREDSRVDFV